MKVFYSVFIFASFFYPHFVVAHIIGRIMFDIRWKLCVDVSIGRSNVLDMLQKTKIRVDYLTEYVYALPS